MATTPSVLQQTAASYATPTTDSFGLAMGVYVGLMNFSKEPYGKAR